MASYASDDDLTTRIPATSAVAEATRLAALEDAKAEISIDLFGDMALRAHVLLTAHYLQLSGAIAGGVGGVVLSRSAGEISVSYASPPAVAVGLHSETSYGRQFDVLLAKVPYAPITDAYE